MSTNPSPDECAVWLRALAEPIRLRIVRELIESPCTVSALAQRVGAAIATVSHHLQVLLHAGILEVEKAGRFSTYRLNREFHRRVGGNVEGRLDFGCCRIDLF